jgi:MFS transporter, DHA1 family, tetracycline resistance protein
LNSAKKRFAGRPLAVVFTTIFIDLLGFGILIPVIPQLLANPRSPYYLLPAGWSLGSGLILLGFLTAVFPLMQFLATPILGQLSDRYGRKPILGLSLLGTSLSYVVFALGIIQRNIPMLFAARAFDGVTGGNLSVAQAAIADITRPEDRAKNFGLIGAAFGLGFILGPYIGGKLSVPGVALVSVASWHALVTPGWFSAATPFWFAAALSFLNVLSVVFLFPETLQKAAESAKIRWNQSFRNIARAASMPKLRAIFVTNFLFASGFAFFTSFFSVFLINRFAYFAGLTGQSRIGDLFAYVGIWIAFTQAVVTRRVAKRLREDQVLNFSIVMTGVMMFCLFLPRSAWQLFLVMPFFAVFNGLSQANSTALVSRSVSGGVQGEVLGINASIAALAQTIPPVLSGYIAATLTPESPIYISAAVIMIAGIFFWTFYRRPSKA